MSPIYENARAKAFISVIFDIVVESLNSAMLNNEEINNLLRQAALVIEQNGSADSLFKQLALEIKEDPETIAMIHMKLDEYRSRIRKALEANQIEFGDDDF
jgi:hypothetical protein